MADEISSYSYTHSPLVYYNDNAVNSGIYIEWERVYTTNIDSYNIYRSSYFDGEYTLIDSVSWPINEYVDPGGSPTSYYKIEEIDTNGAVAATSQPIVGDELLIKSSIRYELEHLLNIPIYDEEIIFRHGRQQGTVAFPFWNYSPRPQIRITSYSQDGDRESMQELSETTPIYRTINASYDPIVYNNDGTVTELTNGNNYPNGLLVKYDYMGNIYFVNTAGNPVAIHTYDTVLVSYNVKMITSQHMNSAMYMALQSINAQPGSSKYTTVAAAPFYYEPAIVYGAAYHILRALLVSLTSRQRRLLIEDPDKETIVSNLKSAADMYKEEFKELVEKLPLARYPTMRGIIVPEFNMPGGRSRFFRYIWNISTGS